jgi:hypothetical protein
VKTKSIDKLEASSRCIAHIVYRPPHFLKPGMEISALAHAACAESCVRRAYPVDRRRCSFVTGLQRMYQRFFGENSMLVKILTQAFFLALFHFVLVLDAEAAVNTVQMILR